MWDGKPISIWQSLGSSPSSPPVSILLNPFLCCVWCEFHWLRSCLFQPTWKASFPGHLSWATAEGYNSFSSNLCMFPQQSHQLCWGRYHIQANEATWVQRNRCLALPPLFTDRISLNLYLLLGRTQKILCVYPTRVVVRTIPENCKLGIHCGMITVHFINCRLTRIRAGD